jgi:hypothetical protein
MTNDEMYVEMNHAQPLQQDSLEMVRTPLTLKQQTQIVNSAIISIKEGTINPIKAELALKSLENVIKDIRDNQEVKSITRAETEKYGKKFDMFGATIENSSRTTYDYSNCGDSVYNDMAKEMEALKARMKAREMMLKTGVDASTGETFNPPIAKTSEFLKIVFNKDAE